MVAALDCVWAAGFFDGEGCITHVCPSPRPQYRYLHIYVTQKDASVLEIFERLWGGKIHRKQKRVSYWALCGMEPIRSFLIDVLPYLRTNKRKQAVIALKCINKQLANKHKRLSTKDRNQIEQYFNLIKKAKHIEI
jgi:hypothetical protein